MRSWQASFCWPQSESHESRPFANQFTTIAFEWFLVHGIVITGGSRLFANPTLVILISVPVSLMFASLLKLTTASAVAMVGRLWTKSATDISRTLPSKASCNPTASRVPSDVHAAGQGTSSVVMRKPQGSPKQDRHPVGV